MSAVSGAELHSALEASEPTVVARRETLSQLLHSPTFVSGILVIVFWSVCAAFATQLAPQDPLAQSSSILAGPSGAHWFGTDQFGRDVFSRVIAGAQSIMTIAPTATLLSVVVGTSLALVIGYFGGLVDDIVCRVIEANFAIPGIILTMLMVAAFGYSMVTVVCVVVYSFSIIIARTLRAAVLAERDRDYVKAAKLRGDGALRIMFVEILPNIVGPLVVEATLRLGYSIFLIASLTFLGFGVGPPSPDWAVQISDNYQLLLSGTDWWTVLFPALAIAFLVVATNLVADALAQVLDR
jgi:peptide/nickel transport system permease protein